MDPGPGLDCLELVGGGEFKSFEKEAVIITKHDHVWAFKLTKPAQNF